MAGVTLNDKKLAAEVRTLTLKQIKKYLETDGSNKEDEAYKKQLLLRLAPTVLPRINEHTGEDGEAMKFNIINYGNNQPPIPSENIPNTSP